MLTHDTTPAPYKNMAPPPLQTTLTGWVIPPPREHTPRVSSPGTITSPHTSSTNAPQINIQYQTAPHLDGPDTTLEVNYITHTGNDNNNYTTTIPHDITTPPPQKYEAAPNPNYTYGVGSTISTGAHTHCGSHGDDGNPKHLIHQRPSRRYTASDGAAVGRTGSDYRC